MGNNSAISFRSCSYGILGSGKTTDAVHELLLYHLKYPTHKIYTNLRIKGVKTIPIVDAGILFEIDEPCFVLPDEFWKDANSHKSMSIVNEAMSMISIRSRKKGWRLHYTVQMPTQIDKRIRYITEVWREPNFYDDVGIVEVRIFDVYGHYLDTHYFDGWYVRKFFNSYDDPLDLDVESLKRAYVAFKAKQRFGR